MHHLHQFYINGKWVDPVRAHRQDLVNPATEKVIAQVSMGSEGDVDAAVAAARHAFTAFSSTDKSTRINLLRCVLDAYNARSEDLAQALCDEMGAPIVWARDAQVWAGRVHLEAAIAALETYEFEQQRGSTRVVKEGIGVAALITPWNWPLNQIVCKVPPALAAGCSVVLKPSEIAPLSAVIFSEIMHDAGVPPGVFNMINGDGPSVGQIMAGHRNVDIVSFTGSTQAGVIVAKTAADTVKRVAQELGGKSANIVLEDANLEYAVRKGVESCMSNTGQSCDAPTRMLVPSSLHAKAMEIAAAVADEQVVGDPREVHTTMGPLVSLRQFNKVQALIEIGIAEGAVLVAGGLGKPDGMMRGYFARPTVFGHVSQHMTIAREEIFGPVLSIMPYENEEQAIGIANDSDFGLAAYVQSEDLQHARVVARRLRAGQVHINYPDWDTHAPFGGYKQSGNGREYADWGMHEFLEIKALIGYGS